MVAANILWAALWGLIYFTFEGGRARLIRSGAQGRAPLRGVSRLREIRSIF